MKKIFFALAALMAFAFAGCEKDGSETDALTGTTWSSSYEGIPVELSFQKGGQATLNMDSERYVGTYTYNKPHVTIQMPIEGRNETFTGTYSDGALNISNSEYGSFVFVQTGGPSPDDKDENTDGPQGAAGKLLKQITITYSEDEAEMYTIEYDAQNRLIRVQAKTLYKEKWYDHETIIATYNGNTVTVVMDDDEGGSLTATLNDEGYIVSEILTWKNDPGESEKCTLTYSNGMLQSFHLTEAYYADGKLYNENHEATYTWSGGNLTATYTERTDEDSCHKTFAYDTSVEIASTNLDLGYLFDCYPKPTGQDEFYLGIAGFYGKASKNPLIKLVHEDGGRYSETSTFTYEFNTDGTVRTAYNTNEGIKYEIEYYE